MKFKEQSRLHRIIKIGIFVERIHLNVVEQFDARHRDAPLDGRDHGIDRSFETVKRNHGGRYCLGNSV